MSGAALAAFAAPVFVGLILLFGTFRRIPVFEEFCTGAKEGMRAAVGVLPSLLALLTAVSMLRASGFTAALSDWLKPAAEFIGFPSAALPSALLRPLSGSGSLAALQQVLAEYGPESMTGLVASVLQSSTETTFYTLTVYFGSVGIKNTRHALPAALLGDVTGLLAAPLMVRWFLGG